MVNLCRLDKCKRAVITFFMLMLITMFTPCFSLTSIAAGDETESTTTEYSGNSDINDFDVSLDKNGNLTTSFNDDSTDNNTLWNWIYAKGKAIIVGITGICALICTGILIVASVRFAGSGANSQSRHNAMIGILVGAIGTALLGGASLIMALSWNFLG